MAAPSSDQLAGQLRVIIPALGTIVSAFGVSTTQVNIYIQTALVLVGPISLLISGIWSYFANSRASIMASAAKPVSAGVPAPVIVLPLQEQRLADALPANVSAKAVPAAALK